MRGKNIIDFSPQLLFIFPFFSVHVFVFEAVRFFPGNIFGVVFD